MPFPKKTPDEIKLATFMFNTEMPEGSLIQDADVTAFDLTDQVDATAEVINAGSVTIIDMLDDDGAVITGREQQWVLVFLRDGIDGHKYRISALATADNGETHQIDKDLPVSVKGALVL
jgi:hypothetical protein